MISFKRLIVPSSGERIESSTMVPDYPIIPFIEGDGIGPEIMKATQSVINKGIEIAYGIKKGIVWFEIEAGEKAFKNYGEWLPEDTLSAISYFKVAIKSPLTTPIGGGHRSLNVSLRQKLDLYACVRPVRYFSGVPSPMKEPEKLDVIIFRENTEDVYAGIEWQQGSEEAKRIINFLRENFDIEIRQDSGLGIKPMSITCTKRLVRAAIKYALEQGRKSVTLVHKGNIMKFTEGAFRDWGYEVAKQEFRDYCVTEEELQQGKISEGKIIINDRIADSMFQQVLTRADEYDVIVTPNLNGDYLSDACAAQVGGLGLAPGANIGDDVALFEPTHGTAPKYTGKNMINPGSLMLSGVMMLQYLGWIEPAKLIEQALSKTILQKKVTYDLERQMQGASRLSTSEFTEAIIENMCI